MAIALIVLASPARSETLDLSCASVDGDGPRNIRLMIDIARSIVMEVGLDGAFEKFNSPLYAATISEQFVEYEEPGAGNSDYKQVGILDRIAGTYNRTYTHKTAYLSHVANYACRRATQYTATRDYLAREAVRQCPLRDIANLIPSKTSCAFLL